MKEKTKKKTKPQKSICYLVVASLIKNTNWNRNSYSAFLPIYLSDTFFLYELNRNEKEKTNNYKDKQILYKHKCPKSMTNFTVTMININFNKKK